MTKKEQKSLSPEDLFAADCRAPFDVVVEERGMRFKVRELDAEEMALVSQSARHEDGSRDELEFRARVIVSGSVEPRFGVQHLEQVKKLSNTVFSALFVAIINGKKN